MNSSTNQAVTIDLELAETYYNAEHSQRQDPERLYEKRWALALLDRAVVRLREELERSAVPRRAARLMSLLTGEQAEIRDLFSVLER